MIKPVHNGLFLKILEVIEHPCYEIQWPLGFPKIVFKLSLTDRCYQHTTELVYKKAFLVFLLSYQDHIYSI